MKKIRIGIVGTGGMANGHADEYKKIPGVSLVAALDVVPGRAEAFAEKHGMPHAFTKLEDLLNEVDAISVVTPDAHHAALSLAILKAGKHLLCEKPLTTTLKDARAVAVAAQAASQNGQIHMVNFSYRRSAAFQKAIALVQQGKLGDLRHVHSHYLQAWLGAPIWGHWTSEAWLWRIQALKSGGVLGDVGCHILDLTTAVSGEVARVRCDLRSFPKMLKGKPVTEYQGAKLDANDSAVIQLEFSNGAIGVVQTTRWAIGHPNHLRCEVHGTDGALWFDLDRSYEKLDVCLGKNVMKSQWETLDLKPTPNIYQRFVTAIKTGKPGQPDAIRGAQIQAYLDACERSAKSGRWESISAWS